MSRFDWLITRVDKVYRDKVDVSVEPDRQGSFGLKAIKESFAPGLLGTDITTAIKTTPYGEPSSIRGFSADFRCHVRLPSGHDIPRHTPDTAHPKLVPSYRL